MTPTSLIIVTDRGSLKAYKVTELRPAALIWNWCRRSIPRTRTAVTRTNSPIKPALSPAGRRPGR